MRRCYLLVLIALMIQPVPSSADENKKEKEPLYLQLNRAVVRLEHDEVIRRENEAAPRSRSVSDGTAFFIHSGRDLYIVSARHVVEKSYDLHARVQTKMKETGESDVVLLELPRSGWVYHENVGDADTHFVDVAAMKIPWIKDRAVKSFRYEPKDSNEHDKNQLPFDDPYPPQAILVFGFPADVGFELLEQKPLGRLGIISMRTRKEFLKMRSKKFAEERCSLIDARMFPGNSGSPVMNEPRLGDSKPRLLGLVIAANDALDFGIIEPVSRIRETLDHASDIPKSGRWKPIADPKPQCPTDRKEAAAKGASS